MHTKKCAVKHIFFVCPTDGGYDLKGNGLDNTFIIRHMI